MPILYKEKNIFVGNNFIFNISKVVFGVGYQKITYIGSLIGLAKDISTKFLNKFMFEAIFLIIRVNYLTDDRLKEIWVQYVKFLEFNKIRRGIRFFKRLPVRGQETHRNAKQAKYLRIFFEV